MRERVLVAMSGGVDSSVAAARLVADGLDVVGVTLHLWDSPDDGSVRGRCCAPEDVHDARRVADELGIPHFTFDRRALFQRAVVDPFVRDYVSGRTPSPCVRCNRSVKIVELLHLADRLGAATVATGHYARTQVVSGAVRLFVARDVRKDQSYFLHMLGSEVLARMRFPLGSSTKEDVRAEALRLRLPGASKGESQELCFVPSGRYDRFVAERAAGGIRPGPLIDDRGVEVGRHDGIHAFTVGQRRNLGVSTGRRLYVVEVDGDSATVRLGGREDLFASGAVVGDTALSSGVAPPFHCDCRVRYHGELHGASVTAMDEDGLVVHFDEPVRAVVPGQYVVFYEGERVLGGGVIVSARRASSRREGGAAAGGAARC